MADYNGKNEWLLCTYIQKYAIYVLIIPTLNSMYLIVIKILESERSDEYLLILRCFYIKNFVLCVFHRNLEYLVKMLQYFNFS